MKIALLTHEYSRQGGIERVVASLAARLPGMGHEVTVVAGRFGEALPEGVRGVRIGVPWRPWIARLWSFWLRAGRWARVNRKTYDAIHAHVPVRAPVDVWTAHSVHGEAIRHVPPAGNPLRRLFDSAIGSRSAAVVRLSEWNLRQPGTLLVAVSRRTAEDLVKSGADPARITVVPNGVDTGKFTPALRERVRARVLASVGASPDSFVLVFSGKEFGRKGLEYAIRALPQCGNRAFLVVVGGNYGKPPLSYFRGLAGACGVTRRVAFVGHTSEVEKYLASGDLFVFPTAYEADPLAPLEARACGLPVLATRVGGLEDSIEDGVNGYVVARDPADIARRVNELMVSPEKLASMSRAAAESAARNDWDRVAADYLSVYGAVGRAGTGP